MSRLIGPALVFVAMVLIGHFATLHMVPGVIMEKTMARMEESGIRPHQFTLAPRTTPQTQTVVRPSPDLAYSICQFDLSGDQSVRVRAGLYADYSSVSFFDARTNNFATVRVGAGDHPASGSEILLRASGSAKFESDSFAGPQFEAPTRRGLILIRRLAPTEAAYNEVISVSSSDSCALVSRS
ncbi:MAG: DUF1254 domain-containing protein [Hyphomonadaceae bacterium]